MSLFSRIRKRQTTIKFGMQPIDSGILERVVNYVEHLKLPVAAGKVQVQLMEELEKGSGNVPYYLLLFAEGTEEGYLNAGYAASMTSYFLHFQGIQAKVLRESSLRLQKKEYDGMHCLAALAFGLEAQKGDLHHSMTADSEIPCILKEQREYWMEEVLDYSQTHFSTTAGAVRIVCQEKWIHFMKKSVNRKCENAAMFEAGCAIAGVMAAAEELWVDLALVDVCELLNEASEAAGVSKAQREKCLTSSTFAGGRNAVGRLFESQEYLVSVCRRKECQGAALQFLRTYAAASEKKSDIPKRNLWKYA